jgi:hypothetical protein
MTAETGAGADIARVRFDGDPRRAMGVQDIAPRHVRWELFHKKGGAVRTGDLGSDSVLAMSTALVVLVWGVFFLLACVPATVGVRWAVQGLRKDIAEMSLAVVSGQLTSDADLE